MALDTAERRPVEFERVLHVAVPAGLAVVTWLILLLAFGVAANADGVGDLNLLAAAGVGFMLWPIYLAAPWQPELTDRLLDWAHGYSDAIAIAFGLLVLRWVPFVPGFVTGILNVPFRAAGILFPAKLFYQTVFGVGVSELLLSFGLWYLEAFWLFVIGSVLAGVLAGVLGRGGGLFTKSSVDDRRYPE